VAIEDVVFARLIDVEVDVVDFDVAVTQLIGSVRGESCQRQQANNSGQNFALERVQRFHDYSPDWIELQVVPIPRAALVAVAQAGDMGPLMKKQAMCHNAVRRQK